MKSNQGEVIATHTVETGPEALMANNIGIQQGDPEKEVDEGIAISMSSPNPKPLFAPPTRNLQVYPRWLVGRGPLHQPYLLPIPWEGESPCRWVSFFLSVEVAIVAL